ncbi:MAG: PIN domain-containing protein [Acidobacteriia bacterium]|nr:PIN domain-containing protein [Terriglobia bacterium]
MAAGVGFAGALALVLAELRLRRAEVNGLAGAVLGAVAGLCGAFLLTLIVSRTAEPEPTKTFVVYAALCAFVYLGTAIGARKGAQLARQASGSAAAAAKPAAAAEAGGKILDTSVLIDGRIADICEAQFLDGVLLVPQFVLRELQMVADSSDPLKRQRGRRGLEVLQRMQKLPGLEVRVVEDDVSREKEVDQKLLELAKRMGAKLVTNDFNLNKVAGVRGIPVLNVNQLANALKPAVLPGEPMRVFILREGKEANQGVAYLDDGTMVVVDGARRFLTKTVDMTVTSVHQTPAGKMIFGRIEERPVQAASAVRAAAATGPGAGANRVSEGPAGGGAGAGVQPLPDSDVD